MLKPAVGRRAESAFPRWFEPVLVVLVVAAVACVPFFGDDYLIYVVALGLTYALSSIGLNVVMGYGSVINIGQAGIFAVGVYTVGILLNQFGVPYLVGIIAAGIAGGLVGVVLALPALRLSGLYLAIVTLAFGLAVERLIPAFPDVTGGHNGLPVDSGFSSTSMLFIVLAVLIAGTVVYRSVLRGGYGSMLKALRDNEVAARAAGVNVVKVKISAMGFSGVLTGVAGALYAGVAGYVIGDSFSLEMTLMFVIIVVLGGGGTIYGPFLGTAFVVVATELLRSSGALHLTYGAAIVLVLLLVPMGLAGLASKVADSRLLGGTSRRGSGK